MSGRRTLTRAGYAAAALVAVGLGAKLHAPISMVQRADASSKTAPTDALTEVAQNVVHFDASFLDPEALRCAEPNRIESCCGVEVEDYRVRNELRERIGELPPPLVSDGSGLPLDDEIWMLRRELRFDGRAAVLATGARSLVTAVFPRLGFAKQTAPMAERCGEEASFLDALAATRTRPLQRISSERLRPGTHELVLTVDMCQSEQNFSREFFEQLAALASESPTPLSVGIALTGAWVEAHELEFDALLSFASFPGIEVTWINHSHRHPVHPSRRGDLFLTHPRVDFDAEVLELERMMLERGQLVAPFFRFPGLVHDRGRLAQLSELTTLALGADAWLANGEPILSGSVILVHGNGNDPLGLALWDEFLRDVHPELVAERLQFVSPARLVQWPSDGRTVAP